MADPEQKGLQFMAEADKKLKSGGGFMGLFGYVCDALCEPNMRSDFFPFLVLAVVETKLKRQSNSMVALLIHLKWQRNGAVCHLVQSFQF